jgi:hypothetical protein
MKRSNHKTIKLRCAVLAVAAMALGWAGTAGAVPPGGLPQCQKDLNTCNANLATCNSNLSQSQSNLATCNSNLSTCQADLVACQAAASAFPATGQTTVRGTEHGQLRGPQRLARPQREGAAKHRELPAL